MPNFHPCSRHHRPESQRMQTPIGVLYKLHMVSLGSAPTAPGSAPRS